MLFCLSSIIKRQFREYICSQKGDKLLNSGVKHVFTWRKIDVQNVFTHVFTQWQAAMQIYGNKRKCLHKKRVQEDLIDRRSYTQPRQLWNESLEKFQAWKGFENMTCAIQVQRFTNWAINPAGRWVLFIYR